MFCVDGSGAQFSLQWCNFSSNSLSLVPLLWAFVSLWLIVNCLSLYFSKSRKTRLSTTSLNSSSHLLKFAPSNSQCSLSFTTVELNFRKRGSLMLPSIPLKCRVIAEWSDLVEGIISQYSFVWSSCKASLTSQKSSRLWMMGDFWRPVKRVAVGLLMGQISTKSCSKHIS